MASLWSLALLIFFGARVMGQETVITTVPGSVPSSATVNVTCTFENQWTAERHPTKYPTEFAHFSPMIIASHSPDYSMWAAGDLASPGVQSVGETGRKIALLEELEAAETVLNFQDGKAMYLSNANSQELGPLSLDSDHSLMSSITKIAPSPDWFTGFYNFNVIDPGTNTWFESFEIESFPWDTGTDSGASYRSNNIPTDPPDSIIQLTVDVLPEDGVFLSPDGTTVLPVGRWSCAVEATSEVPPSNNATVAPTTVDEQTDPPNSQTDPPTNNPVNETTPAPTAASVATGAPTKAPTPAPPPTNSPTQKVTNPPSVAPTIFPTSRPTEPVIPFTVVSTQPSSTPSTEAIGMQCQFKSTWTKERHPREFPDSSIWSPLVVVSHRENYTMWENGEFASPGVRSIATSGRTNLMFAEFDIAEGDVILDEQTSEAVMNSGQANLTLDPIRLDADHSYVSTISKMTKSPDWFSGFAGFNAIDPASNTWYQTFIIATFPWDAGVDSGESYESEPDPTNPRVPVYQLTAVTVPETGVFLDSNGNTVDPVALWQCTQTSAPEIVIEKAESGANLPSMLVTFITLGVLCVIMV